MAGISKSRLHNNNRMLFSRSLTSEITRMFIGPFIKDVTGWIMTRLGNSTMKEIEECMEKRHVYPVLKIENKKGWFAEEDFRKVKKRIKTIIKHGRKCFGDRWNMDYLENEPCEIDIVEYINYYMSLFIDLKFHDFLGDLDRFAHTDLPRLQLLNIYFTKKHHRISKKVWG